MGGVEDDEPASKRLKLASGRLTGLSNGSSLTEPIVGSRDLMARPPQSEGDKEVLGSKGVIKRVEFVRIIAKALHSLGYKKSCAHLEEESGIPLHSSAVDLFMQQVLNGNWDESVVTLHNIGLKDENIVKSASFLILEQKFFELLDGDNIVDALKTLRTEIAPLCVNNGRICELSSCIVSSTHCASVGSSNQDNGRIKPRSKLLEELQKLLPPTVIIPENRLDGKEVECWKGQKTLKISDLEITSDGKQIISMCRPTAILLLDREAKAERVIEEDQTITSFSLSRDNRFLLVNLLNQEIHLWSIDGNIRLVAKYKGHRRTRFVIRSCFGGLEQAFIACGSEDSQVYIWHRGSGDLVEALPGHSGAVNCVSWNPANPYMLASASDDRTIRIWGLNSLHVKHKSAHCNGTHYCNGGT